MFILLLLAMPWLISRHLNANHSANRDWKAAATLLLTRRQPLALSKIEIEWVFTQVRRGVANKYGNAHAQRIFPLLSCSARIYLLSALKG